MQYAIYIAAAAVICLLIGLVTVSLTWLRKTVLQNIRSKTLGLLSMYDELLEEKSRQLAQVSAAPEESVSQPEAAMPARAEEEYKVLTNAILNVAQQASTSAHRDSQLGGLYQTIRQNFGYQPEDVMAQLEQSTPAQPGPATGLLEKLDFESVYQLSTLTQGDQLEVLKEILSPEEMPLLEAYTRQTNRFRILEFFDHLRSVAATEPHPPRIWIAPDMASRYDTTGKIQVAIDPQICEGYQIERDNVLYDFSIKTRELK